MNIQPRDPALSDVFITEELDRRPVVEADHLREKLALQELVGRLGDQPEDILPRFVDLAMEMTGGVSAGLSLYEEDPAPGLFRWRYLRGSLAQFENATTPRDFSPCTVTLEQNGPVLSTHPERVYGWIADADIEAPEVLLVPLQVNPNDPLGTLWILSDQEGHFHRGHVRAISELASFVGIAVRILRSEERLKRALQEQETLAREMGHRVKNVFAIAEAVTRLSARNTATKEQLVEALTGRLRALANAHALASRNGNDAPGRTSEVGELIRAVIAPHDEGGRRCVIEGPSVRCGEHAITGLAMVFHELATNATKYGALAADGGRLVVTLRREEDALQIDWVETGGPAIPAPPSEEGFGSTLVRQAVAGQLRGVLVYDWAREGLRVSLRIPMKALAA